MSPESTDQLIGQCLDERYVLEDLIGYGGMSRIYKALDLRLHTTVAVKVLNDNFAADAQVRKRFAAEAVIAANLRHPNVLKILDHNASGRLVYLVMDYVRGQNLHELITTRGRLTPRQALSLLEDICRGLAAAHAEQIVHRDMKPGNVLISNTGEVKITDFGLARAASAHTQSATLLATLHYASPELLSGQPADARSDIYAVGVMIYQMLTGQVPYPDASVPTLIHHHLESEMPLPSTRVPDLAQDLDELVRFCTEKDPENRPQHASFLLDELIQIRSTLTPEQLDLGSETYGGLTDLLPLGAPAPTSVHQRLDQFEASREADGEPWWLDNPHEPQTTVLPGQGAPTQMHDASSAPTEALGLAAMGKDQAGHRTVPQPHPPTDDQPAHAESFEPQPTAAIERDGGAAQPGPEAAPLSKRERARAARRWRRQAQIPTHQLTASRSAGRRVLSVVLVLLAVTLVAAAGWFFGKGPGSIFSVPKLSGLLQAQAVQALDEAGVPVRLQAAHDDEVAVGRVVHTNPGAGENIMRFQGVELVVSSGPQVFTMPDVTGLTAEAATARLTGMQLRSPATSTRYSPTVKEGLVISSTPAAGAELTRKSATALVLSAGPAPVRVPQLAGLDEAAARTTLAEHGLGLALGDPVFSSDVPAGRVAVQDPSGGTVAPGSSITVQLSMGPEYLQIPSVIGMPVKQAEATLEQAGFTVQQRRLLGTRSETVRMQTPLNQRAERGAQITIYVF